MKCFQKGDRVRATQKALDSGCFRHVRGAEPGTVFGTVVGMADDPHVVRILRDGLKTPDTWGRGFWEVLPKGTTR